MRTVLIPVTYKDGSNENIEVEIRDEDGVVSAHINDTIFVSLDLSPLSSLTELQKLYIRWNKLTSLDLSPLSSLKGLQQLSFSGNYSLKILDLSPLNSLTGLQELDIWENNSLTTLDLSSLTGLEKLCICQNERLTSLDLGPLNSPAGLHQLDISGNIRLKSLDLSSLSGLTGLRQLKIRWNEELASLDLNPLNNLTGLETLVISENKKLETMDLDPLSGLTGLQKLDISKNNLTSLNLGALSNLIGLQQLSFSGRYSLERLDLSPLSGLIGLQNLELSVNDSLSPESFLSPRTISSIAPLIFSAIPRFWVVARKISFTFTPLSSFQFIAHLLPIVEEYEPPWKMHHLIQGTLALLDLEWLGILDRNCESFARTLYQWAEPDFRESAREKFVSHWTEQIESGGTTLGISLEHIRVFPELSLMADRIIELRAQEMEGLTLSTNFGVVDLRPLYLTAYGYQILQSLKMGQTCSVKKFEEVSEALEELDFGVEVKEQSGQEKFSPPPHMSASLCEYIFHLVE